MQCIQFEKGQYIYMNEVDKINGAIIFEYSHDKIILEDFKKILLRFDFYNRTLDKLQEFINLEKYKFTKLLPGQILFKRFPENQKFYEPFYDLNYREFQMIFHSVSV